MRIVCDKKKFKVKCFCVLKVTWISKKQWIWSEDSRTIVCAFPPFPKKKQHEKCKSGKLEVLEPQAIYTSKPHLFIDVM
jgi:hypothetical protein